MNCMHEDLCEPYDQDLGTYCDGFLDINMFAEKLDNWDEFSYNRFTDDLLDTRETEF